MLDDGIEQPFHLVETSEGCKRRRAFLDKEFASRAGLDFFQAAEEVFARNLQRAQFFSCNAISVEGSRGKEAAQSNHADFLSQSFEVGADEPVGMLGDLPQIHVRREGHCAGVDPEDL